MPQTESERRAALAAVATTVRGWSAPPNVAALDAAIAAATANKEAVVKAWNDQVTAATRAAIENGAHWPGDPSVPIDGYATIAPVRMGTAHGGPLIVDGFAYTRIDTNGTAVGRAGKVAA